MMKEKGILGLSAISEGEELYMENKEETQQRRGILENRELKKSWEGDLRNPELEQQTKNNVLRTQKTLETAQNCESNIEEEYLEKNLEENEGKDSIQINKLLKMIEEIRRKQRWIEKLLDENHELKKKKVLEKGRWVKNGKIMNLQRQEKHEKYWQILIGMMAAILFITVAKTLMNIL